VLLAADGMTNNAVADKVGVHSATVVKWRKRFIQRRLDGLVDEPRPGAPRTISDEAVEAVVVRTLEDKPLDATHWSTRDLAKRAGMSASSVGRIWQAFGLKPWLVDTFKLSEDPLFVDKVRDVVGLYMNPPEHAVVYVWMRRPASKRSIVRNRRCRCAPAKSSDARMIMCVTASPTCSPR
jgi:transposase